MKMQWNHLSETDLYSHNFYLASNVSMSLKSVLLMGHIYNKVYPTKYKRITIYTVTSSSVDAWTELILPRSSTRAPQNIKTKQNKEIWNILLPLIYRTIHPKNLSIVEYQILIWKDMDKTTYSRPNVQTSHVLLFTSQHEYRARWSHAVQQKY